MTNCLLCLWVLHFENTPLHKRNLHVLRSLPMKIISGWSFFHFCIIDHIIIMALETLSSYYEFILETGDKRTADMPFIKSPKHVICAVVLYLLMVIFGPRVMERRQPFQLRYVLIGYNFFSVIFSCWMMWEVSILSLIYWNKNKGH